MAEAALFTSPMARKKRVANHYDPNSYRVISHQAEYIPVARPEKTAKITSAANLLGQPKEPRPESEHRHNRPNPRNVTFLRQDVRLLNEPVCNVSTITTNDQQHNWWPHRTSLEPLKQPSKPLDTTVRKDFQYRGNEVKPSSRFSASSPNKKEAVGIIPVNFLREPDNKQRFWKEGISYEHQYNCRLDPQYPVRAKRHGSFVWNQMQPVEVNELLHHHNVIANKESQTKTMSANGGVQTRGQQTNPIAMVTSATDAMPSVAM